MAKTIAPTASDANAVTQALLGLVSRIPRSKEPVSAAPKERAQAIARATAIKAAGISGAAALPPGFIGLATIIPDLLAIWRLQQSMVADIAAVYGKTAFLGKETMIYCLFKHGAAALMRDLVMRVGERFLVRRVALRTVQQILRKLGVTLTQRVLGRGISRFLPVVGSLGVGAYAYYDTTQVAATAIELFSQRLTVDTAEAMKLARELFAKLPKGK